jgi:hypothetical protein
MIFIEKVNSRWSVASTALTLPPQPSQNGPQVTGTITAGGTATQTPGPGSNNGGGGTSNDSVKVIVGGVVGGVLGVLIIVGVIIVMSRRYSYKKAMIQSHVEEVGTAERKETQAVENTEVDTLPQTINGRGQLDVSGRLHP